MQIEGDVPLFVFPNPATNEITVQFAENPSGENKVCILNLQGKVLIEQIADNISMNLDIEEISKGIYFLSYQGNEGFAYVKFIKM
ncbi:MAG: T9SS type A sorting domain-containing protein [Saprospiraceae bacterium]|nr:T9SS type A sorting domain-containing protein [Saprospiraceae bacterium]